MQARVGGPAGSGALNWPLVQQHSGPGWQARRWHFACKRASRDPAQAKLALWHMPLPRICAPCSVGEGVCRWPPAQPSRWIWRLTAAVYVYLPYTSLFLMSSALCLDMGASLNACKAHRSGHCLCFPAHAHCLPRPAPLTHAPPHQPSSTHNCTQFEMQMNTWTIRLEIQSMRMGSL